MAKQGDVLTVRIGNKGQRHAVVFSPGVDEPGMWVPLCGLPEIVFERDEQISPVGGPVTCAGCKRAKRLLDGVFERGDA
ncbi:MAG: hypothetical protein WC683_13035 [bacterium]